MKITWKLSQDESTIVPKKQFWHQIPHNLGIKLRIKIIISIITVRASPAYM